MIGYNDLSANQKKAICNGCGGKGGFLNPPEFLFKASCNQHDFYYWRGGTESDRKIADVAFYEAMKKDISLREWYKQLHYHIIAFAYYKSVRIFGKKYFNYGTMKNEYDLEELCNV